MSRRARENEHASQFSTNQSSLNLDGLCVCNNEKVNLQKSFRLALFNVHMYDEFHGPDVLIVLLYM